MSTALPLVEVKKPRISGPKLEKLCGLLRSWRRQTKGRRIECQRHHLRYDVLSKFSPTELVAALTWAEIGKGGTSTVFDQVYEEVVMQLDGRDVVNVIYDFAGIEDFIPEGLAKVTGESGDRSENPETNMSFAMLTAIKAGTMVSMVA